MILRLLVVDPYYPAFLDAHYAAHPDLAQRSYEEQLQSLMSQSFGTGDVYSHHLRKLGHTAGEIVPNCEPLELRWAHEIGLARGRLKRPLRLLPGRAGAVGRRLLLRSLALAQIEAFEPDVVYVQDPWFFGTADLRSIRRPGRLLVGQIASALPQTERLRCFDLLVTALPHYVEHFRSLGIDSAYLALAFDERVLDRIGEAGRDGDPVSDRPYGLTFVGGLNPTIYGNGTRVLERIASEFELIVWGFDGDALKDGSQILRDYRGQAWGLEMYRVLSRSRIALNRHGEVARGYAANMRLFEATGMGALLVTEAAVNLRELFEPGSEIVAYEGEDDLVDRLRYYLQHGDERKEVAAAGQARTLRDHTYGKRIGELVEILERRL